MLLSASIRWALLLSGLFDGGGDDLRIAAEPLGLLDELTALDLEDLDKSAAFMVRRGDLERRHQTPEAEILDRLEALLHILAGRLLPPVRLDRQPRCAAEEMRYHEVGAIALGDVEHLRAHLDPRRRNREGSELEPFDFLQILDDRDRLATGRVVEKDVGDLLALEVAAQFVL